MSIETDSPVVFNLDKPDMSLQRTFEFWRMRRVSDKDHANMVVTMVDIKHVIPQAIPWSSKSVIVKVPVAVPCKKIKAGDELVLYIPAKQKTAKTDKLLPAKHESAPKKQKTVA